MKTIIPKVGDWVDCGDWKESHGKVSQVSARTFFGEFFSDEGSPGEDEVPLWKIVSIVTDKKLIAELEAELAGNLNGKGGIL